MANLVIFGSLASNFELDEEEKKALLAEPIHGIGDRTAGFVLAKIYGYREEAICVTLDKPILAWMPSVSAPANDCGFQYPQQAWTIHEDVFKEAMASPLDRRGDGISLVIEDFRFEDGWFIGVVRFKVVAGGIKLIDIGLPFKTKSDTVLIDQNIGAFKLKAVLSVESANPPMVCVNVTIKGPLGYKEKKRVCT